MRFGRIRFALFLSVIIGICVSLIRCQNESSTTSPYLNHNDTVQYVGIDACKNCHYEIYQSFIRTGMGKSFKRALESKSAANFHQVKPVYDSFKDLYYIPFTISDSMYVKEFRLGKNKDTVFSRTQKIDYIVGSGQHTNSHLYQVNGYLYQIPITWYVQKKIWGLAPGFEGGHNVRFSRAIEMECMSCHNALPQNDKRASNKYISIPEGINCERCHGPGSLHVFEKTQGHLIDTSKQMDPTIINPRRLSRQQQIDICQRCHLQGNTVLKEGKSFSDFRPGMKLNDFMEVYNPHYKGRDDEFIMASHAQRLQQSQCYIKSVNPSDESKKFTCISCHNPHVSVKETGAQVFNQSCMQCHSKQNCKESLLNRNRLQDNCVQCHMPISGTSDIPHVSIHDHRIQIPKLKITLPSKVFDGLNCIHTKQSTIQSRVEAFLNYVEKFDGETSALDSVPTYIATDKKGLGHYWIRYYFIQHDYFKLIQFIQKENMNTNELNHWEQYCVAEAFANTGQYSEALIWINSALKTQTLNLDYLQRKAAWLIVAQQLDEAEHLLLQICATNPYLEESWVNLGFLQVQKQQFENAMQSYGKALALNPDYEQALLNRAALYHILKQDSKALKDLYHLQALNPKRDEVAELIKELKHIQN